MKGSRRNVLAGATSTAVVAMAGSVPALWSPSRAQQSEMPPDLIVHNGKVTTLQSNQPEAQAFATRGEKIVAVGGDAEIMGLRARQHPAHRRGRTARYSRPQRQSYTLGTRSAALQS